MKSALARELKENSAYLRDSGFQSTATLMDIAANEIDRLAARIAHLERRESEHPRFFFPSIARLFGF
jgi:hypothetical protein